MIVRVQGPPNLSFGRDLAAAGTLNSFILSNLRFTPRGHRRVASNLHLRTNRSRLVVIARAADYAMRLLAALFNCGGRRLKVADLAAATAVPKNYVLKVMVPLVRRGWVQSSRGSGGGFSLVGGAESITLLDVVEAFEGPLHLNLCTGPTGCQFLSRCPMHSVWVEAEAALHRVLAKYTIAELAAKSGPQGLFLSREYVA